MKITDKLKHAWNAFSNNEKLSNYDHGSSSSRPVYKTVSSYNMSSYVSSVYNRIAIDASMTGFKHAKINPDNEDLEVMKTGLQNCLSVEANIDQSHIQFIHDLVYSMFDEGVVAVVPVETTISPGVSGSYDIVTLRVGKIVQWFPQAIRVRLYNEGTGQNEDITLEKRNVAIVENPLYAVVNGENSTLKQLISKLNQLDNVDALASSNRLDVLISVPYGIKTETQKKMAEKRIADIESQLATGRNGIAYIDGTEKATQLNRPVNNQLPETIERLRQQFYNQLGLTENIFNGTANEAELRAYYTRAIDPILENIVSEFTRKFLTKTARTQGQKIVYFRDMFKTVPVETIATLGDTFRRNYIASSNEIRKIIGFKPSSDPRADELFNPNIADNNQSSSPGAITPKTDEQLRADRLQSRVDKLVKKKEVKP
jgi:hypothetical protein